MNSRKIRQQFLDFFESKGHKIVASAPMVNKNDPTLMFTNAGMNQFKDFFLGNQIPDNPRIADTQKCLRVSGKHNDLEEVGRDSYHHTMFEMLGNWSIGDYFKEEAIDWAWELLTEVYKLDKNRLYVSVFQGDESEGLERDNEAATFWKKHVPEDRILYFDKKDNFWEMGDTGPCGPCSEIHYDLRTPEQQLAKDARELVNNDDPLVVEIWNLVFIQFNRKADGSLENLPAKHVDTGMGFERLCMAIQAKKSNYDTDVFSPFIEQVAKTSGKTYTASYADDAYVDIAMRVVVDHLRAVSFAIADGQLPGNTGAGYVIRRILRRAVRYYYSFLDIKQPFLHTLVPLLSDYFGDVFPELVGQKNQIKKVIEGEERSFLNTLENGLNRFAQLDVASGQITGADAFELYDTFGFPIDLTRLIASEKGLTIDEAGFDKALQEQKARSRADAKKAVGDWIEILSQNQTEFVGYDELLVEDAKVIKYRQVKDKRGDRYQIVLNRTPFYGESGGQAGDQGVLHFGNELIRVVDTQKENDLIVHITEELPNKIEWEVLAEVDDTRRHAIERNHTATHLMHAALHSILGEHALQKGQDVDGARLRFDFSHFQKVEDSEVRAIEEMVNEKIRENIPLEEARNVPIEEARKTGAMMLFGEKYGDSVRVITFDENFSRELCGGTHVQATGQIGQFKIVSESSVASGIRRIEAVTGTEAEAFFQNELDELGAVRQLFKNAPHPARQVAALQDENRALKKEIEKMQAAQAGSIKDELIQAAVQKDGYKLLAAVVPISDGAALKNLVFQLEQELSPAVIVLGANVSDKPQLMINITKSLTETTELNAGKLIRQIASHIKGGGGGQPFFASAGGKDASGLDAAIAAAKEAV
ncbi:MAG: alanine--tRNA ligase [Saprospiraceae bacterium]|nr:alanine--tRNA ligase [Saprospiraceae bacterium]